MTEDQPRGKGNGLFLWHVALCTQPGCHAVRNTYTSDLDAAIADLRLARWRLEPRDDLGPAVYKWLCAVHSPKGEA